MLHDRIAKRKIETRKHNNEIAETEKIWTEIETLQWVLLESGSIRRQLGEKEEYNDNNQLNNYFIDSVDLSSVGLTKRLLTPSEDIIIIKRKKL